MGVAGKRGSVSRRKQVGECAGGVRATETGLEGNLFSKRDVISCRKRPNSVKRDLKSYRKNIVSNETKYHVERDLIVSKET